MAETPLERMLASVPEPARAYLEGRRLDEVECIVADLAGDRKSVV